ncbi:MAG: JAB domain-containing protein [Gammaproteobacteria bacterium]|nr:JAB domain-containing protein [Gammaproteobacteria bacterium]
MAITDWPADERPREKLLLRGASALSDAELLAIFLRTGIKGMTAVDLARNLLEQHGSLRELLAADQSEFCGNLGLGPAKYALLQAVLEMGRRHLWETLTRSDTLASPGDTRNYLTARLRGQRNEVFACLFLDNKNRVIEYEELFFGTIDGASVHPRQIIQRALSHNAAGLILAHNHPSGVAEPSQSDRQITRRIKEALSLLDIRLLDHLVVGDGEITSLAEIGWV